MAFFKRGVDVKFWFWDPQKAHPCAELRFFDIFCVDVRGGVLAVGRVNIGARSRACAERNPLSDLNKILQGDMYPRRNHH